MMQQEYDAEVTNPNTRAVILKAIRERLVIVYTLDEETGKLYIKLE